MSGSGQFLLDTSAVITWPDASEYLDAEFVVSSITLAELYSGIHTATDPIERAVRLDRLEWLTSDFDPLPFTSSTARMYGQLNALVLASGRKPRSRQMDLLIASVAAVHRLPLVTRNVKDFLGLAPLVEVIDLNG